MRLTALAGYFAFVILCANGSSYVHAQSLDINTIENSNYLVAMDDTIPQSKILLSAESTTPKKPKKAVSYIVKDGDTLVGIAHKYKVSWQRIYDKNHSITNPDIINPGDKIVIPDAKEKLKERSVPQAEIAVMENTAAQPQQIRSASPPAQTYRSGASTSSGNSYGYGYCTYYAKIKRPDLPNNLGNADTWAARAAAQGFATGSTPRAGAIGQQGMHVVYVERVNPGGTVTISEMNYAGWGVVSSRTVPASTFIYIY